MRGFPVALMASVFCLVGACGDRSPAGKSQIGAVLQGGAIKGAAGQALIAGRDFEIISPPQAVMLGSSHPIQVVEFFWYECPHCYRLEPHLVIWNRLVRSADVEFVRVPAAWRGAQRAHARLYYTLVALGREDLHEAVFDTVHRLGNPLYDPDEKLTFQQQLRFAEAHGISREAFTKAYYSPSIDTALDRAVELAKLSHVTAVPILVVDGRYATDERKTKGNEYELLNIVNALVKHEQDLRGASVGVAPSATVSAAGVMAQPAASKR